MRLLALSLALCLVNHAADNPGMAQQRNERRKHVRRPVFLNCRIEGTAVAGSLQLTDLSESGCFIATSETLPVGSQVTIHVVLSGTEIPLMGRVIRVQPGRGVGIEIIRVGSQQARRALDAFLYQVVST